MRRMSDFVYPFAFALVCGLSGASALAETIVCDGGGAAGSGAGKISAVPFTISLPGVYCVTAKISSNLASGAAITINANNVVLDLNDFAIGNLGAGPSTAAIGIFAVDRQNIVVRNGILRGFWAAVAFLNGTSVGLTTALSSGHLVDGVISDTSYAAGIAAQGPYVTVRNSKVMNTKGSNIASPPAPGATNQASGILVGPGSGVHVVNNAVLDTDCTNGCIAGAKVRAIDANPSESPVISNNRLINGALATGSTTSTAIHFGGGNNGTGFSSNAFVGQNLLSNWATGIDFTNGSTGDIVENGSQGVATFNNAGTLIGTTNY